MVTEEERILLDSKRVLEGMSISGVSSAKTLDELWKILNESITRFARKGDFRTVSAIYLSMGIINKSEGKYKDCIRNYLHCSHFGAHEMVGKYESEGVKLSFKDLMASENYMTSAPVNASIKNLGLKGVNENKLGKLAVTQQLSIDEKNRILSEVLEGDNSRLNAIKFGGAVRARRTNKSNRQLNKGRTGCLGVSMFIILIPSLIVLFVQIIL